MNLHEAIELVSRCKPWELAPMPSGPLRRLLLDLKVALVENAELKALVSDYEEKTLTTLKIPRLQEETKTEAVPVEAPPPPKKQIPRPKPPSDPVDEIILAKFAKERLAELVENSGLLSVEKRPKKGVFVEGYAVVAFRILEELRKAGEDGLSARDVSRLLDSGIDPAHSVMRGLKHIEILHWPGKGKTKITAKGLLVLESYHHGKVSPSLVDAISLAIHRASVNAPIADTAKLKIAKIPSPAAPVYTKKNKTAKGKHAGFRGTPRDTSKLVECPKMKTKLTEKACLKRFEAATKGEMKYGACVRCALGKSRADGEKQD